VVDSGHQLAIPARSGPAPEIPGRYRYRLTDPLSRRSPGPNRPPPLAWGGQEEQAISARIAALPKRGQDGPAVERQRFSQRRPSLRHSSAVGMGVEEDQEQSIRAGVPHLLLLASEESLPVAQSRLERDAHRDHPEGEQHVPRPKVTESRDGRFQTSWDEGWNQAQESRRHARMRGISKAGIGRVPGQHQVVAEQS